MILLLGGTTEAKQVAEYLDEAGIAYIYSTRTEVVFTGKGQYRFGSLDCEGLKRYCIDNQVSLIIDACHPFAKELHDTVATIANQIPVIRFERAFAAHSKSELVRYVNDYNEALFEIARQGYHSMLVLAGVQSIPKLSSFWKTKQCWFRIIDRQYSIDLAAQYGFPSHNLLFGLPQDKEAEITLFRELKPQVILTKESGLNGKLDVKIAAAIACDIPIFIIKKPKLSPLFKTIQNLAELLNIIA